MHHKSSDFPIWKQRSSAGRLAAVVVSLILALPGFAVADTASGLADFQRGAFAEAYQEWRAAAASGDPRGALFVGVLYDTGEGVVPDTAQALDWYRQAAAAGSAPGTFNVAVMYDSGRGTPRDPGQAATWYARASELGYARADYNLALMLESGDGLPRNRTRSIFYFRRAAGHGISAARTHLASLGQASLVQPLTATAHAPDDSAMHDFEQAQQLLLTRGPADAARATALFRRAAEQHNGMAEYDLGYCYEHGIGVPRSLTLAGELYRRAATHASDDALRSLAMTGARSLDGQLTQQASEHAPSPADARAR